MKNLCVLSMSISLAMICSCEKQDSTVETQFAQRKVELDSREQALDEREKALEQRERAVAEREKVVPNSRIIQRRTQVPDAAQAEAERQKRIQQLPPELRALIPDRSRIDAGKIGKEETAQEQAAQFQRGMENARRNKMSAIAAPAQAIPDADTGSQSPTPTP